MPNFEVISVHYELVDGVLSPVTMPHGEVQADYGDAIILLIGELMSACMAGFHVKLREDSINAANPIFELFVDLASMETGQVSATIGVHELKENAEDAGNQPGNNQGHSAPTN